MLRMITSHPIGLIPWVAILLLAIALVALVVHAEEPATSTPESLMRAKLIHAQKTLEGLATGDFDMVATNAQRLELLSRDVGWIVLQTKEYREYSDQFRRDANRMAAAAKAKNLDAAGLAYVQLTLTCIHCHDHVRAEKQRQ